MVINLSFKYLTLGFILWNITYRNTLATNIGEKAIQNKGTVLLSSEDNYKRIVDIARGLQHTSHIGMTEVLDSKTSFTMNKTDNKEKITQINRENIKDDLDKVVITEEKLVIKEGLVQDSFKVFADTARAVGIPVNSYIANNEVHPTIYYGILDAKTLLDLYYFDFDIQEDIESLHGISTNSWVSGSLRNLILKSSPISPLGVLLMSYAEQGVHWISPIQGQIIEQKFNVSDDDYISSKSAEYIYNPVDKDLKGKESENNSLELGKVQVEKAEVELIKEQLLGKDVLLGNKVEIQGIKNTNTSSPSYTKPVQTKMQRENSDLLTILSELGFNNDALSKYIDSKP
ncbi:uncharacterized protein CMU_008810 [Cryptosporidium muris RN66]|uniref:Uncharacterized protein n=1 Tax=Cryptosporidium muris (strain RN66) TaxID=441375 RepID=B6ADU9_CRYMR|nr:uncharacterized protein CMU_008810 [Cryptosporidium muris RN66]EEA06390.1 hypothetical protein CMU_008810 [Cryptosporidium muris RN66]|eukprot:XP_002140739.1 hypothetical protein [Cryptosporidium muris RN66]